MSAVIAMPDIPTGFAALPIIFAAAWHAVAQILVLGAWLLGLVGLAAVAVRRWAR